MIEILQFFENYRLEIFWCTLYTLVLIAIFLERAYYYSVEREHAGLRRIAGYGVTVTRGAASAMMFTYSSLLVTMCRNTITRLRDTILHQYIPFDSAVDMHKYIAVWALVFTARTSCQSSITGAGKLSLESLANLTALIFHVLSTHELPKFHYWCWETLTGVTGVALATLTALIFTFSLPYTRSTLFDWF
ncbi:hypothetical protein B566_EDAN014119 [Ephemera danica]|nr:hypothetical protein B566_EDAN014119 [Ephemera danica]